MKTLEEYTMSGKFSQGQLNVIKKGLDKNLNVSVYAKPEFNCLQMKLILHGLEDGLDVSTYAKPLLTIKEMRYIMRGLKAKAK